MYPILLELGPVKIYAYGTMLAISFLIGIYSVAYQAEKEGISKNDIYDLSFYCILSAIIGARILYVIVNIKTFIDNPLEILFFHRGGLVFYGGLLGAFATCYIYLKKKKLPEWQIGDLVAPYVALGIGLTRIGCFLNGCCFGKITGAPWGVTFPLKSPAGDFYGGSYCIHPTQIYELIYCFLIFIFLIYYKKHKKFHGQLFWLFVLLYSILRAINEMLRGDYERGIYLTLSTSQWISIFTGIASVFMLVYLKKNPLNKR